MKRLSYLLSAAVLVFAISLTGCGSDDGDDLSPTDAAGNNFSGTWAVDGSQASQVTFDGNDRTNEGFSNFQMNVTFETGTSGGDYTVSGGPAGETPFTTPGTWAFNNETPGANNFTVTRGDGVEVSVSIAEGGTMTLNFTISDRDNQTSRTEALEGAWQFVLQQQ